VHRTKRTAILVSLFVAFAVFARADGRQKVDVTSKPAILWEPGHEITVNIKPPNTGDGTRDEEYNRAVEKALKEWNDYQVKTFGDKGYRVKSTKNGTGKFDVTIQWQDALTSKVEGNTDITAIKERNAGGVNIYRNTEATITLTRKTNSGKPRSADAIEFLTQHEFGHAEGLNHVGSKEVMSDGSTFAKTDDAPSPVDLFQDSSAKQAKSSVHDTKLENNTNIWKLYKYDSDKENKKLSYHYDAAMDYFAGSIAQVGVRVSDPFLSVSDLPTGWEAIFEPDVDLGDLTFNDLNTFVQPGEGTGWLTLFATDTQYYATAATGFDFTVATFLDLDTFYGLDLYTLRADNGMPYYAVDTVPAVVSEPASIVLLGLGFMSIVGARRSRA